MQKITDAILDNTCLLAKISLDDKQREQMKADLEDIIKAFDLLQEIDTSEVEPLIHVHGGTNVLREDCPRQFETSCEMLGKAEGEVHAKEQILEMDGSSETLSGAPKQKNNMFVVPKTIG